MGKKNGKNKVANVAADFLIPSSKEEIKPTKVRKPSKLETPFKWGKEYGTPLDSGWLDRHRSEGDQIIRLQPLKFCARVLFQVFKIWLTEKDCSQGKQIIERFQNLYKKNEKVLKLKQIDIAGFNYLFDAMIWSLNYHEHRQIAKDNHNLQEKKSSFEAFIDNFKLLSPSAKGVILGIKLLYMKDVRRPLEEQKKFGKVELIDTKFANFEVLHIYSRILRKIRHQQRIERLHLYSLPNPEEIRPLEKALMADRDNYKLQISLCELLLDFLAVSESNWNTLEFKILNLEFQHQKDVFIYMNGVLRSLLISNPYSVRLNNMATKLNIQAHYRRLFCDDLVGKGCLQWSLKINENSASANFLMGGRNYYYSEYEDGLMCFKRAYDVKPSEPKYVLSYARALTAYSLIKKRHPSGEEFTLMMDGQMDEILEKSQNFEWSEWNRMHVKFLYGLYWFPRKQGVTIENWRDIFAQKQLFQQLNYLSPRGLKVLMLQQIKPKEIEKIFNCVEKNICKPADGKVFENFSAVRERVKQFTESAAQQKQRRPKVKAVVNKNNKENVKKGEVGPFDLDEYLFRHVIPQPNPNPPAPQKPMKFDASCKRQGNDNSKMVKIPGQTTDALDKFTYTKNWKKRLTMAVL